MLIKSRGRQEIIMTISTVDHFEIKNRKSEEREVICSNIILRFRTTLSSMCVDERNGSLESKMIKR